MLPFNRFWWNFAGLSNHQLNAISQYWRLSIDMRVFCSVLIFPMKSRYKRVGVWHMLENRIVWCIDGSWDYGPIFRFWPPIVEFPAIAIYWDYLRPKNDGRKTKPISIHFQHVVVGSKIVSFWNSLCTSPLRRDSDSDIYLYAKWTLCDKVTISKDWLLHFSVDSCRNDQVQATAMRITECNCHIQDDIKR